MHALVTAKATLRSEELRTISRLDHSSKEGDKVVTCLLVAAQIVLSAQHLARGQRGHHAAERRTLYSLGRHRHTWLSAQCGSSIHGPVYGPQHPRTAAVSPNLIGGFFGLRRRTTSSSSKASRSDSEWSAEARCGPLPLKVARGTQIHSFRSLMHSFPIMDEHRRLFLALVIDGGAGPAGPVTSLGVCW